MLSINLGSLSTPVVRAVHKAIAFGVAVGIVAGALSLLLPNQYASEGRILPRTPKSGGLQMMAAAAALGLQIGDGSDDSGLVQMEILQSRWMAEEVLAHAVDIPAERAPGMKSPFKGTIADWFRAASKGRAVEEVRRSVTASRDPKSGVITLRVMMGNPELSRQVATFVVVSLERFLRERVQTQGAAKAQFIKSRIQEVMAEAKDVEARLRAFLDQNRNFSLSLDPAVRLAGLRLESELAMKRQIIATLTASYEQAVIEEKDDRPILTLLDRPDRPTEKSAPSRLRLALGAMMAAIMLAFLWERRDAIQSSTGARGPEV